MIDHAYVTKPPYNPKSIGFESFQVSEYMRHTGKVMHPNSTGTEAPVLRTLPDLLYFWLLTCILHHVL